MHCIFSKKKDRERKKRQNVYFFHWLRIGENVNKLVHFYSGLHINYSNKQSCLKILSVISCKMKMQLHACCSIILMFVYWFLSNLILYGNNLHVCTSSCQICSQSDKYVSKYVDKWGTPRSDCVKFMQKGEIQYVHV